jgi:hypothetical protein
MEKSSKIAEVIDFCDNLETSILPSLFKNQLEIFSLQLFKLYFYLEWVQVGTSKCSKSKNDPSRIFFGIFSRGKLTILGANFLKMTFVRNVRGQSCPETDQSLFKNFGFCIYGFLDP